ncbi:MAG: BON domain-containing protein [Candidatus Eremiobacteraeota bacterium]|nr:BON domain-containing protein [Candidatus Eremiobacteraeota bacterium]
MKNVACVALLSTALLAACSGEQQRQVQSSAQNDALIAAVSAKLVGVDADAVTAVHVGANGGSVTLSGEARNDGERAQYVTAARSVSGVTRVNDEIAVNPHLRGVRERSGDAWLAAKVAAAIAGQAGVNVFHVDTTAKSGVVTLRGTVPARSVAETIVSTARGVPGVRHIDDQMTIK